MNRNPVKEPGSEFWAFVWIAILCVWVFFRLR